MLSLRCLLPVLLMVHLPVTAQKLKKPDKEIIHNLETHVRYLADDQLEGRRTGTHGEMLAMEYIKQQFEKDGLSPKGNNSGYYQDFNINMGKSVDKSSYLFINGDEIGAGKFFPVTFSPEHIIEASPSIALKEAGVPWFLDVKEDMKTAANNPHFNNASYLLAKAKDAYRKGATALFIYNSDAGAPEQQYDTRDKADLAIPVVMVANDVAQKYFKDETATLAIRLNIKFIDNTRTGHNVIGYVDNGAASTVILGAHFDHLGYGEDGGSLLQTGEKLVHNGADDNASGIAALIELSALLKHSMLKKNNYLFIAFSGEELGLLGSKYFVAHPTIDLSQANYMVNMDMIGRLNDSTKTLLVAGYGTSPVWPQLMKNIGDSRYFNNRYDSSGTGPSDHTSFYQAGIPVLFFFTGVHSDYHRPTDDADKINYTGEYRILQFIYKLVAATNKTGKLAFTKTRAVQTGTSTFAVTLGIMPDYSFNGNGVRIDVISEGRPAQKAGLKSGDVVVQLGDYPVTSLETYMNALNKFKAGETTQVKIQRAGQIVQTAITF